MSVQDQQERDVLLFESAWALNYCAELNPDIRFHDSF
jgi:peptide subunit release factor RF-3